MQAESFKPKPSLGVRMKNEREQTVHEIIKGGKFAREKAYSHSNHSNLIDKG
jgi:hypothetical protein